MDTQPNPRQVPSQAGEGGRPLAPDPLLQARTSLWLERGEALGRIAQRLVAGFGNLRDRAVAGRRQVAIKGSVTPPPQAG